MKVGFHGDCRSVCPQDALPRASNGVSRPCNTMSMGCASAERVELHIGGEDRCRGSACWMCMRLFENAAGHCDRSHGELG